MTSTNSFSTTYTPSADGTDGREAHPGRWYAAFTRSNTERTAAAALTRNGFETYIPTRVEMRQWSDRRKRVEVLLMPRVVFIRTAPERLPELVRMSCLTSILRSPGQREAAVIPDAEMNRFIFLVGNATEGIEVTPPRVVKGEKVVITRGSLRGLEGMATQDSEGMSRLTILIDNLCCASVSVPLIDLSPV